MAEPAVNWAANARVSAVVCRAPFSLVACVAALDRFGGRVLAAAYPEKPLAALLVSLISLQML